MTVAEYNYCVDQFADKLYRFVIKNLCDEEKAKDIIQDSFEKMWIRHEGISFEKAKSYLFTTAYHTMIDKLRKDNRITNTEMQDINTYHDSKLNTTDLKDVLNKALDKLPEIQKAVILLRDYEGYSYREIAEITELNESQVKVYIYRGRLFLKKYIGSIETLV